MADPEMLQVHAVENATDHSGTCIVRCISGVVRIGDVFTTAENSPNTATTLLSIEKIERYREVFVDFIDPPHAAKVHFSGPGTGSLEHGDILIAAHSDPDEPTE
ncbi:hypothetical protein [Streptomyces thermolilacinus]|uniref:hypothetical protein n=1 Tax=Streptomyces thermolilacinus TaxID=285540 RepID=UPI001112E4F3|nr:hypothetical protein [Streptomyces thermolilacinus]